METDKPQIKRLPILSTVGKTLKNSTIELYHSLGYSLTTSFVWFFAFLPILYILMMMFSILLGVGQEKNLVNSGFMFLVCVVLIALFNGLVTGPVTTAFFALFQERKEAYPSVGSFLKFLSRFYWLSARVHLVYSALVSILIFNVLVMLFDKGLLMKATGIFSFYGLLFMMLLSVYLHPLIYYRNRFREVFKKAFVLTLDNLALGICLSLIMALIFMLSVLLIFPILLLFGALYIYLLDNGFELIAHKYEPAVENGEKEE